MLKSNSCCDILCYSFPCNCLYRCSDKCMNMRHCILHGNCLHS